MHDLKNNDPDRENRLGHCFEVKAKKLVIIQILLGVQYMQKFAKMYKLASLRYVLLIFNLWITVIAAKRVIQVARLFHVTACSDLMKEKDFRAVENLTREAFWNVFKPGCDPRY